MARYRHIKRKDGRTQRAMVLASGRLKFVKNTTGRKARKSTTQTMAKRRKSRKSTALTTRRRTHRAPARRRRRSGGAGFGGVPIIPVALSAAGLAYLTGTQGPKQVRDLAMKIPGAKTFGPLAVAGGACLVVDRFVKRNKWLRLAGIVGVAAAAMKVGEQGSNFKFVGDGDYDISDIGDYDDVADVGDDDDMGDVGDDGDY